ncbi:MAG: ABC transporter ATP-binding protein [Acidobacteriota bacterium]
MAAAETSARADGLAIRLAEVRKSFGEKVVLDGLDLEVRAGESLVVLGGSGSGKSVMLKHIIGLMRPDSGAIEVDGVDLATLDERELIEFRHRFGMSFQEGALFDSMTVRRNIAFPLQRRRNGRSGHEIDARVDECLALVGLEGQGDKMPAELSGGMRRRVGFARAIAQEPRILLFDEPTTGLDPVLTAIVDQVVRDLLSETGATAITITHDMASAFRIADRMALLYKGRILASERPEAFRHLEDPRVQQFIHGEAEGPLTDPAEAVRRA